MSDTVAGKSGEASGAGAPRRTRPPAAHRPARRVAPTHALRTLLPHGPGGSSDESASLRGHTAPAGHPCAADEPVARRAEGLIAGHAYGIMDLYEEQGLCPSRSATPMARCPPPLPPPKHARDSWAVRLGPPGLRGWRPRGKRASDACPGQIAIPFRACLSFRRTAHPMLLLSNALVTLRLLRVAAGGAGNGRAPGAKRGSNGRK